MTLIQAIRYGAEYLAPRDIAAPRLEAELLLAHLLSMKRMELYLDLARVVTPAEVDRFHELLSRRARHEPSQYILGTAVFCGLEMEVNRDVLIPRPETEVLAEAAWTQLAQCPRTRAALDFGTGSGCLAIAMAVHCPDSVITAIDSSAAALCLARRNAERHGVAERVRFLCVDGIGGLPSQQQFDLIATNPPYIPSAELAGLAPEVREFEPVLALDGGPDGLDFYRALAGRSRAILKPGGWFLAEFGDDQGPRIVDIFKSHHWAGTELAPDLSGRTRILIAR